jgi:hypothetical protein
MCQLGWGTAGKSPQYLLVHVISAYLLSGQITQSLVVGLGIIHSITSNRNW